MWERENIRKFGWCTLCGYCCDSSIELGLLLFLPMHFSLVLRCFSFSLSSIDFLSAFSFFSCWWSLFRLFVSFLLFYFGLFSSQTHTHMSMHVYSVSLFISLFHLKKFLEMRSSKCIDVRALHSFVPFFSTHFHLHFWLGFHFMELMKSRESFNEYQN